MTKRKAVAPRIPKTPFGINGWKASALKPCCNPVAAYIASITSTVNPNTTAVVPDPFAPLTLMTVKIRIITIAVIGMLTGIQYEIIVAEPTAINTA